eukprot:COSAG02_NODE_10242_length_1988_cov_2.014375_1_plen_157_part_00
MGLRLWSRACRVVVSTGLIPRAKEGPPSGRGLKKGKQTRKAPTARFPRFLKSLEDGRADDMPCAPSRVDLFLRLPRYCRGLDLKTVILRVLEIPTDHSVVCGRESTREDDAERARARTLHATNLAHPRSANGRKLRYPRSVDACLQPRLMAVLGLA